MLTIVLLCQATPYVPFANRTTEYDVQDDDHQKFDKEMLRQVLKDNVDMDPARMCSARDGVPILLDAYRK
jgi:hypothetical protein